MAQKKVFMLRLVYRLLAFILGATLAVLTIQNCQAQCSSTEELQYSYWMGAPRSWCEINSLVNEFNQDMEELSISTRSTLITCGVWRRQVSSDLKSWNNTDENLFVRVPSILSYDYYVSLLSQTSYKEENGMLTARFEVYWPEQKESIVYYRWVYEPASGYSND